MKTIKIRLEACSFSIDQAACDPFIHVSNDRTSSGASFQAVVGRSVTQLDAEPNSLVQDIGVGDRLCCMANLPNLATSVIPTEIDIPPYIAHQLPSDIDAAACVATLPSALRVYTALHSLARIRKSESILVACPNDLNFTTVALQICQNLNLMVYAIVQDEAAAAALQQRLNETPKNILKLDNIASSDITETLDKLSGSLGFDCILDFKNDDPVAASLDTFTVKKLIQALAAFGRIVTDRHGNAISASDVNILHLKSCSVHFLLDQIWHLSPLYYGRHKHIMADIIALLKDQKLRPLINLESNSSHMEEVSAKHDERLGCTVIRFT